MATFGILHKVCLRDTETVEEKDGELIGHIELVLPIFLGRSHIANEAHHEDGAKIHEDPLGILASAAKGQDPAQGNPSRKGKDYGEEGETTSFTGSKIIIGSSYPLIRLRLSQFGEIAAKVRYEDREVDREAAE